VQEAWEKYPLIGARRSLRLPGDECHD
jgi:hypothetical protein